MPSMRMARPSMGGGGASSADQVSCIDVDGNQSDVQTELDKIHSDYSISTPRKTGDKWIDGKDIYEVCLQVYNNTPSTNSNRREFVTNGILTGVDSLIEAKGLYTAHGGGVDGNSYLIGHVATSPSMTCQYFGTFNVGSNSVNMNIALLDGWGTTAVTCDVILKFTII